MTRSSRSRIRSQAGRTADPSLLVSLARTTAETRAVEARFARRRLKKKEQPASVKKQSHRLAPLGHVLNVILRPQGSVRLDTDSDLMAQSGNRVRPQSPRPASLRPASPTVRSPSPGKTPDAGSSSAGKQRQESKGSKKQAKGQKRGASSAGSPPATAAPAAPAGKGKQGKRQSSKQRK